MKPLTSLQGYALASVSKCVTLILFLLMFEKFVLKVDDVSFDGAGCHPPPFLLKDGCNILCLVASMQCEILTRLQVLVAPYQMSLS